MSQSQGSHIQPEQSSALAEWCIQHKKTLIASLALFLVAATFTVWWMSTRSKQQIRDFEQAEYLAKSLDDMQKKPVSIASSLQNLQALVDTHPELQSQYDGIIAQEAIILKDASKIDPYAARSVQQLSKNDLARFALFSEASSQCGKNELQNALNTLNTARATYSAMPQENEQVLFACTLFNIAALQAALGNTEAHDQVLTELKSYIKSLPEAGSSRQALKELFYENDIAIIETLSF